MKKLAHCSIITLLVLMSIGLCFLSTPASAHYQKHFPTIRPMIFVHGGSGSGAQFESQAMRFTSNGYPQNYIAVLEYDSSSYATILNQIYANLDQLIAALLTETGANQVDLLGHSLGTFVSQGYLRSSPARAAKVAHYVNIDGAGSTDLPGGVPTLALWAGNDPPNFGPPGPRTIVGATNVTIPGVPHIECATCAESFFEMYKFFTGHEPETTEILPEPHGQISIAGRAVLFPQNVGVANSTLEIYKVNGDTGFRIHKKPEAIYPIGGDGNWGPFKAKAGGYYEFVIVRPALNHHFYLEPFIRDDYLIRLNTSPIGGGIGALLTRNDRQTDLIVTRYKEFLGDQGVNNDILAVNGVNLVNATFCPLSKLSSTVFAYDVEGDGQSDLSHLKGLINTITFLSAVDFYIPAANPPDDRIRIVLMPRGGEGKMQVMNVPNWPSSTNSMTVIFSDFLQKENLPCGDGAKYWW
jgi:hypothetical protein